MDRSVYEDLTAAEVLSTTEDILSFRFFYDNIRAKIVAKSNEYDKEQFKGVTYKSLYDMFDYWSSDDYIGLVESIRNAYSEKMSVYQVKIDSVSEHFRGIIDSVKTKGAPQFDFARIFKHPVVHNISYYSYRPFPNGDSKVSFELPIKDLGLFYECGITRVTYKVICFEKGKQPPLYTTGKGNIYGMYGMELKDNKWSCPSYHYTVINLGNMAAFMNVYDPQKSPKENFNNAYDWYYVVENVGVSYKNDPPTSYISYLKQRVPSAVYKYWEAQEGDDMLRYVNARNNMIKEFANADYSTSSQFFTEEVERHLKDKFKDEYLVYQRIKKFIPSLTEEFETMVGRFPVNNSEWLPTDLRLPVSHSNGNYVRAVDYDKRIFREGSGPDYL